jgi:hypothetical protein
MLTVWLLIAVAALIALAWWWRRGGQHERARAGRAPGLKPRPDNYHCVELRYRVNACDAVKRIGGKRFLPGEAPVIPLPGCDAAKCGCRYVHHDDRRHSDRRDRFGPQVGPSSASTGTDRRTKTDRRKPSKARFKPTIGR